MRDKNKHSVVIPFFNAEETLELCLQALVAQTLSPLEVILVDNNSNDQSARIAKQFANQYPNTFHYLFEPQQGPSFARNCGTEQARGDIIVYTDADCMPESNWLVNITDTFTDPQIGAVAGRVIGYETKSVLDKFHALFTLKGLSKSETFHEFTIARGGFATANLAVRKDIFDTIRGFDGLMKTYGEDYDLCARIYKQGFSIQYTTGAVVYHKHRNSLKSTWLQSYGFGIGHAKLLRKHFKRMLIIDLPRYQYMSRKWPVCIWIDLVGADKKLLFLISLSILWWPVPILIPLYLLMLYRNMVGRLQQNNLNAGFFENWQLVLLLLFKSVALTTGRLVGMLKNKVLCI